MLFGSSCVPALTSEAQFQGVLWRSLPSLSPHWTSLLLPLVCAHVSAAFHNGLQCSGQLASGGTDILRLGIQITLPQCSTWLYFITLRDLQPLFNISKPQFL